MLKVKPKRCELPTGKVLNIIGINARFINEFPVSVAPIEAFSFYIEFVTEDGDRRDAINANSHEFVGFLVSQGLPEAEAKVILAQTFAALLVGTREQRYEAISGLVSFYKYELLPIEEQEGHIEPIVEAEGITV